MLNEKTNSPLKKFLLSLTVAIVIGLTFFALFLADKQSQKQIDETTLCPNTGAIGHLAILIDTTDPLSRTQLQFGRDMIRGIVEKSPVGTRVSFSTVSADLDERQAIFKICKPISREEANRFIENPEIIGETYEQKFQKPLNEVLDGLLFVETEAQSSPIMETLQQFISSIDGFINDDTPKMLVLMSDLMQFSDNFSLYRGGSWEKFTNSGGARHLARSLQDVKISILRIPNDKAGPEVDIFWIKYFEAQGASDITTRDLGDR